jgi:hypothetical protein
MHVEGGSPSAAIEATGSKAMHNQALSALLSAWITTLVATSLLAAAIAIAPMWNTAIYLRALPAALRLAP